jgi:peptidoglycan/xylan/chitin deacetylase (PgdA/CDA1 family)
VFHLYLPHKKKFFLFIPSLLLLSLIVVLFISTSFYQGIPVLNYHQINDLDHNSLTVNSKQFDRQMQYLSDNGYTTITPNELADSLESDKKLPEKSILITFDDGYKDNYTCAFPILEKYNMKATIFLITDYVNTYPKYLNWNEINEMQAASINFESHTLSHIDLTTAATDAELRKQLLDSRKALEWRLHKKVNFIAYPCGTYDTHIIEATKDAGYRGAFTVNFGSARTGMPMYALDRIPIFGGNSHTFLRFRLRLRFSTFFSSLKGFKADLDKNGHTLLSRIIFIP